MAKNPTRARTSASKSAFARARRRFWRSERGATIAEYGIMAAIAATALGAIDAPRDRPAVCAPGERSSVWLDKDAVARESCAVARPAVSPHRI